MQITHRLEVDLRRSFLLALLFLAMTATGAAQSSTPDQLPLVHLGDFLYQGAFRLPAATFGVSDMNYSEGPLEYNPLRHSIYIVGHSHHQAIAEFGIPALVLSSSVGDLNIADGPLQDFSTVLDRISGGNPQSLDRIGGLLLLSGSIGTPLLVNIYEYYDAPGDNTQTTIVMREPGNIAASIIDGPFTFAGGAGHTSGWMSPIPSEWQTALGGTHITGQSSGLPIISRFTVGPSAFAFNPLDFLGAAPSEIPTATLLDFSLAEPLHQDLSNESLANNLWTHLSRVVYGFIPPGTRTYVTLGHSAGHRGGICYKCTPSDGSDCGGYCAIDASDYYHFYWLWDLRDLVAVREGRLSPSAVRPYEYGEFPTPFKTRELGGGTFDSQNQVLYLTVQRADLLQGEYDNPPVVVAYKINAGSNGGTPADPGTTHTAVMGKLGRRTVLCIRLAGQSQNMARLDRGSSQGSPMSVKGALRLIKKALREVNLSLGATSPTTKLRRKKRNLKSTLSNLRRCPSLFAAG